MNHKKIQEISRLLFESLQDCSTIEPLTESYPEITIDDAYEISKRFLSLREQNGEKIVGKKIGVTSDVVQKMLDVNQPDFGFLTDRMQIENKSTYKISQQLIQPRAEAEIAFVLNEDLRGPGIRKEDVLSVTEKIFPCFEIVDSRINNWQIKIQDTIADNASCGVFLLGDGFNYQNDYELDKLEVKVSKNGEYLSSGYGSAVQGHPAEAVAWLANTLGKYNIPLLKGEIILSGSLVPLEPAIAGDHFYMELIGIGDCEVYFS
ncbi:fumarylacetoacetate hydrolase family protein [SAR86 cluster bacterium]|nr:fumarylacetoacetate hydrolase family protein [SAR86 cluster bacterium]|tara:strand:- start:1596 stop:2381 length:786 start_codon:yes stop_codon:yes gene_type:complete